jgi:hypothetical protein
MSGLVLLKYYSELRAHLTALDSRVTSDSSYPLGSDMWLLVHEFLADGEVFKSFGYENLYELWEIFQQAQVGLDISVLGEGFHAVDRGFDLAEDQGIPQTPDTPGFGTEDAGFDDVLTSIEAGQTPLRLPTLANSGNAGGLFEPSYEAAPVGPQIEKAMSADPLTTLEKSATQAAVSISGPYSGGLYRLETTGSRNICRTGGRREGGGL